MVCHISDESVERLKVLDKYVSEEEYSMVIICDKQRTIDNILRIILKKCVGLKSMGYTIIPSVTDEYTINFVRDSISGGKQLIVGISYDTWKLIEEDYEQKVRYILIESDIDGLTINVTPRGM